MKKQNSTPTQGFTTRAIHTQAADPLTGSVIQPIYQTSTYTKGTSDYVYSRVTHPNRNSLERTLASLEEAAHGFVFASGMAAIHTLLVDLKAGDEIICVNPTYGGNYRLLSSVLVPKGIVVHYVDMSNLDNIDAKLGSATRLVWVETPSNPLIQVYDIAEIAALTHTTQALLIVDNTLASSYIQTPISLGADVSLYSATKYLGGHSDVIMGALVTNNDVLADRIRFIQKTIGAVPGPMDIFLMLRSLRTLEVRMERHVANAKQLAAYLSQHPVVGVVHYPGLKSHPGYAIASKQMRNPGAMLSFEFKDNSPIQADLFAQRLQLFQFAESLGGVESLICIPALMTHSSIPQDQRKAWGLFDNLLRMSVGIEDINDLIADIDQALLVL